MAPVSDALLREPIRLAGEDEGGDRDRIRAKAGMLVQAALRAFPDAKPPPFRPEMYTELLGIPVIYSREIDGWDALLVPTPAGYRILCNDRMPAARRAFTLCHEVGHTFFAGSQEERYFHRTKQRKSYLTREKARLERACDIAAAELLMPEPWFDEAVGRRGLRAAAVPELCREFAVSLEAAALRLVETASRPCAVGFFEFGLPPSARSRSGSARRSPSEQSPTMAYRVRRVFPSRGFPFLFPEGKSVPRSSVIYRSSLQLGELEAEEIFSLGSRQQARLRVCAFPLHKREQVTEPPTVCALFTTA